HWSPMPHTGRDTGVAVRVRRDSSYEVVAGLQIVHRRRDEVTRLVVFEHSKLGRALTHAHISNDKKVPCAVECGVIDCGERPGDRSVAPDPNWRATRIIFDRDKRWIAASRNACNVTIAQR